MKKVVCKECKSKINFIDATPVFDINEMVRLGSERYRPKYVCPDCNLAYKIKYRPGKLALDVLSSNFC